MVFGKSRYRGLTCLQRESASEVCGECDGIVKAALGGKCRHEYTLYLYLKDPGMIECLVEVHSVAILGELSFFFHGRLSISGSTVLKKTLQRPLPWNTKAPFSFTYTSRPPFSR